MYDTNDPCELGGLRVCYVHWSYVMIEEIIDSILYMQHPVVTMGLVIILHCFFRVLSLASGRAIVTVDLRLRLIGPL
jgi:hypothetical protein